MGTNPTKAADNFYCKCRKAAAMYNDKLNSREGAAELLGLSASTLTDYELGITKVVPAESILRMADLYNSPEIKNYYCREVCPLGEDVLPISLCGLDRITIKALSALKDIDDIKESLLDITADGKITKDEIPKLNEIIKELDELNAITQSLKVWAEKNLEEG